MNKKSGDAIPHKIVAELKPIVLDSVNIIKYPADELVKRNGQPISDTIFNIHYIFNRKQLALWRFYPPNSNEKIRELVWKTDSISYVTIWYHLEEHKIWGAFDFVFWNEYMEF